MEMNDEYINLPTDAKAMEEGCYYDTDSANKVIDFATRFLKPTKGVKAGQPLTLLDWQEKLLRTIFGWKRADGTRRYSRVFVLIPKKNGKSFLLSCISLYMLVADKEPGAQVYIAAVDKGQAGIIYREASAMARGSAALAKHLIIPSGEANNTKTIAYPERNAFMKVLSGDAFRNEGIDSSCTLIDELHAHKNRQLWDALDKAGAARLSPLHISITTAGWDTSSLCYQQQKAAQDVLDGKSNDIALLPVIYAAGKDDDWTKEETWYKANPSLGQTLPIRNFRDDFIKAQNNPVEENAFKRYRLNIWTATESYWISDSGWMECAAQVDKDSLRGKPCFGGLDLSTRNDITAFVKLFQNEDGTIDVVPTFWIPEDRAIEKERIDKVPYTAWHRQGFLEYTPGNVIDYEHIAKFLTAQAELYDIQEIGIDRWNAKFLYPMFRQYGCIAGDTCNFVEVGQGGQSLSEPFKHIEMLVQQKKIRHSGNPVLRWMVQGVRMEADKLGNVSATKQKSTHRIDGVMAMATAFNRLLTMEEEVDNTKAFHDTYSKNGYRFRFI